MFELLTLLLVSDLPAPEPEPVLHGLWELAQQVATFLVALLTIWVLGGRWVWKRWEAKRDTERVERDRRRTAQIHDEVEHAVGPLREQLGEIHHTTHVNSHVSDEPTMLDRLGEVGARVETAVQVVGAVAANQATLSARMDRHESLHHGVDPE